MNNITTTLNNFRSGSLLSQKGSALVSVLIIGVAFFIVIGVTLRWGVTEKSINKRHILRHEAKNASESIVEYGFSEMVRKFMLPRYKKITDLLHSYGVDVIYVDSDGNLNELIPLWLEVGINYVWPLEVAAHNDAVALREMYGKDLIMSGNIDKRALIKGKEAIREEVMSKVPFLLEQGGYFPTVDHTVPPDVTFENYCYYINLMREVAGLEKLSFN